MMQKNEGKLLDLWILYHSHLVGIKNLYVFDNHSTDCHTLQTLKGFAEKGMNVKYGFDFRDKGSVICKAIKELDAKTGYDFLFPLDCDEFIAIPTNKGLDFNTSKIQALLANYAKSKDVLMVRKCVHNNPFRPDYYRIDGCRKTFFTGKTCDALDLGFHGGRTVTYLQKETQIHYLHFHYRPYLQYIEASKQKMKGRIDNFDEDTLRNYKGDGVHLAHRLLHMNTKEKYTDFFKNFDVYIPEFSEHIKKISNGKLGLSELWQQ